MRKIDRTTSFRKDYKRESKGRYRAILDDELQTVLSALINDFPLDLRYLDHDFGNNCLDIESYHSELFG